METPEAYVVDTIIGVTSFSKERYVGFFFIYYNWENIERKRSIKMEMGEYVEEEKDGVKCGGVQRRETGMSGLCTVLVLSWDSDLWNRLDWNGERERGQRHWVVIGGEGSCGRWDHTIDTNKQEEREIKGCFIELKENLIWCHFEIIHINIYDYETSYELYNNIN